MTLSAEASALIRSDYLQSLHNKLIYARPTEAEQDWLLSEISRIEDESFTSGHLTNNLMYKPEPEPLEVLESRKRELMNKIVNGSHLDSLSMKALQDGLAGVTKKIEERKREEVK